MPEDGEPVVLRWDDARADLALAGGKGASLARLSRGGFPVPAGFHVTTAAYRAFVAEHELAAPIAAALATDDADVASQAIKPLFTAHRVPESIADAVRSAYALLSEGATDGIEVAARSSATTEDLPEASFAGQQESVLGVRGHAAVIDALRQCWASLWSARAIAYRRWALEREDLCARPDLVDPALAVAVQCLVPADAAGVLFTADPTTGARDQVLINATWGIGESLVGGRVDPDTYVVDQSNSSIIDRRLGAKAVRTVRLPGGGTREETVPDELRTRPALGDDQVLALADLGARVAEVQGAPVDIEWATQGRHCWLLQARPITHLPPDPRDLDDAEGWNDSLTGDFLWTSANLGEAIPSVMTPATWSLVRLFMSEAMSLSSLGGYRLAGNIGGRFYLNLSIAWGTSSALGLRRLARTGLEQAFGRLPDGVVVPPLPLPRHTVVREALAAAVPFLRRVATYQRQLPELLVDAPRRAAALRDAVTDAKDPAALRALWPEVETRLRETSRMLAAGSRADGAGLVRIRPRLARLVDDVDALMTGLSTEHDQLDSLGPVLGIAAVRRGEMDRETYAQTWGHRCPDEFELSVPRPSETPGWLDAQLTAVADADREPEVLLRRRATARNLAWNRLVARHPRRARRVRRALDRAAHAARTRERARSEVVRIFGVARAFVLRAGALSGHGGDLFFLEHEEILAVLDGDTTALARVPARRRFDERHRALGPYPMLIRGAFDPERWAGNLDRRLDLFDATATVGCPASEPTIRGAPASAGVVEGVVRVLSRLEDGDALQPGEVLVTTVTNVGWTPLFPRAAAVVTDVGAQLSHAAIVARELGIPAVVGCGVATSRLTTGDHVRVDGGAGTVAVLD